MHNDWDEDDDIETPVMRKASIIRAPNSIADNPTWNGKLIRKMESDHVMNAILYCEKRFVEARNNWIECHSFGAELESQIASAKVNFYFKSVYDMFPDYRYLRAEWDRRANL